MYMQDSMDCAWTCTATLEVRRPHAHTLADSAQNDPYAPTLTAHDCLHATTRVLFAFCPMGTWGVMYRPRAVRHHTLITNNQLGSSHPTDSTANMLLAPASPAAAAPPLVIHTDLTRGLALQWLA